MDRRKYQETHKDLFGSKLSQAQFPESVFIVKEVFPKGIIGCLQLNGKHEIMHINRQLSDYLGLEHKDKLIGTLFFRLFVDRERLRLEEFFRQIRMNFSSTLTYLKLKKDSKRTIWISMYSKKEYVGKKEIGYSVVLLNLNDYFATLAKDRFDELYISFFEMYETELDRIGIVLRDNIAQELYALKISVQNFILTHGFKNEITPIKDVLNRIIKQISDMANEVSPSILTQIGFLPAVDEMVSAIQRLGFPLHYKIDKKLETRNPELQFCCYRVVQALFEAWKKIDIPQKAFLTLSDQGAKIMIEWNEEKVADSDLDIQIIDGFMLQKIKNRIALYSGTLEIIQTSKNKHLIVTLYN